MNALKPIQTFHMLLTSSLSAFHLPLQRSSLPFSLGLENLSDPRFHHRVLCYFDRPCTEALEYDSDSDDPTIGEKRSF